VGDANVIGCSAAAPLPRHVVWERTTGRTCHCTAGRTAAAGSRTPCQTATTWCGCWCPWPSGNTSRGEGAHAGRAWGERDGAHAHLTSQVLPFCGLPHVPRARALTVNNMPNNPFRAVRNQRSKTVSARGRGSNIMEGESEAVHGPQRTHRNTASGNCRRRDAERPPWWSLNPIARFVFARAGGARPRDKPTAHCRDSDAARRAAVGEAQKFQRLGKRNRGVAALQTPPPPSFRAPARCSARGPARHTLPPHCAPNRDCRCCGSKVGCEGITTRRPGV